MYTTHCGRSATVIALMRGGQRRKEKNCHSVTKELQVTKPYLGFKSGWKHRNQSTQEQDVLENELLGMVV